MPIGMKLPVELASLVVDSCDIGSLLALCLTSKAWQVLGQRSLFHKVDLRTLNHCVACCHTFLKRKDLCQSVKEFLLMFESSDCLFPVFWHLLARVLCIMPNLAALHFAMSGPSNIVLRDCTFPRLCVLSSVLDLSPELNAFLVRHPSIKQLCIGGEASGEHLALSTSALPALETYLGSRTLAQDIVPGRPVAQMTLAWTTALPDGNISDVIQTLAHSSVPVRHFSCATFGGDTNGSIMRALAEHMPDLYTLRISNVASVWPSDVPSFVTSVSLSLKKFKKLRRFDIPCVANANDEVYDAEQESTDSGMVTLWSSDSVCPTLEVMTLPSCTIWRLERGRGIWSRAIDGRAVTDSELF